MVSAITGSGVRHGRIAQQSRSAENPDKLAPSGSGSFDAGRIRPFRNRSLQALVRAEAMRELCEECGLPQKDVHAIQICGYGRYIYRAGKPEFFCVATTAKVYNEVSVPTRELDWQHKQKSGMRLVPLDRDAGLETLRNTMIAALTQHAHELEHNNASQPVSGPLLWNLRLAADYLRHTRDVHLSQLLEPLMSTN